MSDGTGIEWTEATWNPIAGCSIVSPGCTNCYAMKMAARIEAMATAPHYAGLTQPSKGGAVWTGKIANAPDHILTQPLRWKRGRMIFVNSMSDLFHEAVPEAVIDHVFAVMALSPQHRFQVLTKRPERMRDYLSKDREEIVWKAQFRVVPAGGHAFVDWPLPNVWLGTSVEDQRRADERIPALLATPAAVRFISAEPLLGPIDLERIDDGAAHREVPREEWGQVDDEDSPPALWWDTLTGQRSIMHGGATGDWSRCDASLDWVIVGGESGPDARPMHPDWARSLRDQCVVAGVAFFFKQWGEWAPGENATGPSARVERGAWSSEQGWSFRDIGRRESETMHFDNAPDLWRLGKKSAGRLLDGVEHNGLPDREAAE